MPNTPVPPSSRQRVVYIMMPLILLLLLLALINWLPRQFVATTTPTATPAPTQTAVIPTATTPTATKEVVQTAVVPTSTDTPTPNPTPINSTITLLGPPANTTTTQNSRLSFYWRWPHPLTKAQRFTVYLEQAGQKQLLGSVQEPNLGKLYQLQANLSQVGQFVWFVQLEDSSTGAPLRVSVQRPLNIVRQP